MQPLARFVGALKMHKQCHELTEKCTFSCFSGAGLSALAQHLTTNTYTCCCLLSLLTIPYAPVMCTQFLVVNSQNHLLTCTQLGGGSLRLAASCSSPIIACAADWLTQDSAWLLEQATTCVDSYFAASLPTAASPVTTPEVEAWSAEADRWGIAASSGISAGNILQAHGLL